MEENDIAKNILIDKICATCCYNGLYSSINYMKLPECHYWLLTDRKHELSFNPPNISDEGTCEKWKQR